MSSVDPGERVQRALGYFRAGQVALARRQCEKALALVPQHFDARHLLGVMALHSGRTREALHHLAKAVRIAPGEAQAQSNLATALRRAGQPVEAEAKARRAVELEPTRGEYVVNLAQTLGDLGRWDEALALFRRAAEQAPALGGLRYDIGRVLNRLERYPEAEQALHDALAVEPTHRDATIEFGLALMGQGRIKEAVQGYKCWLEHDPDAHGVLFNLAQIQAQRDRHIEALDLFECAARLAPQDAHGLGLLALEYETLNRLDTAERFARRALQRAPELPSARLALARLLRRRGEAAKALDLLQGMESTGKDWLESALWNERGRLHERLGTYPAAWQAWERSNRIAAVTGRADPEAYRQEVARHICLFDGGTLTEAARRARAEPSVPLGFIPVFHFGFPRSGTTLTDQILAAHPAVSVFEEKAAFQHIIWPVWEEGEEAVTQVFLDPARREALRTAYRQRVLELTDGHPRPVVVDKMPLYTVQAGEIAVLFPEARMLFAQRHPYDVCLSCLGQHFVDNSALANFLDPEHTVGLYEIVMDFWGRLREMIPMTVFVHRYEELVANPAHDIKMLCAFLDLEPDPAMLDVTESARERVGIRTASYAQVVEAISTVAVGRYRHYLPELPAVFHRLDRFVETFGYGQENDR